ncbi:MAG: YARHG domain-containing protein [Muribaculaceae bacterium]|nr:YARHG domain-containing protein [Muribaculaceae bacterium]
MKLFLKTILLAAVALTFTLGTAPQMQAQTGKKKSQTTKSRPAVWGTEFDWLSTQYITLSDIRYYSSAERRILRNSIYARHGRRFKSNDLSRFFFQYSWYQPYRNEVPERELNKYEKANIQFLKKHE